MLVDIFSSFDDHNTVFFGSLFFFMWLGSFSALFFVSVKYWLPSNRWVAVVSLLKSTVVSLVNLSTGIQLLHFKLVITTVFVFILFTNLCGLIPYMFGNSSHLAVTLVLSVPLWLALVGSGFFRGMRVTLGNLLPSGSPVALSPFLILVESISVAIRPFILALRLAANMTAGHIVLSLIGGFFASSLVVGSKSMYLLGSVEIFYHMFEFGVGCIQAYIFVLLVVLYSNDHVVSYYFTRF
uniref:ATP synthase F0 subunit 6 n=1 Tax=Cocculina enigmadonta TaxID=2729702 RepID=UPI00220107B0|nr:ATP synthase F0 subunit 6 [Cocculina enigmadonta]UXN84348.1 ATP synthase F0 subunit 6 [Cocculina enigmadonta]